MASTQIWDEAERPQTLADQGFTPTSIENVEFPDDVAPVAYQANRALMSYNSKKELQVLHAMNQQTAAYPTLSCLSGPKVPGVQGGSSCEVGAMEARSHAITAYSEGRPLFPQFHEANTDMCETMREQGAGMYPTRLPLASGSPPIGYSEEEEQKEKHVLKHTGMRMLNSVRGALYDLQHFNELPPAQRGEAPSSVATFAMTRDNRLPYLFLVVIAVLVLIAVVAAFKTQMSKKQRG